MTIQPGKLWTKKFHPVFLDIFAHKHQNYIFPGGRGSTKSSFISEMIPMSIINNPTCHALVFRKVANTLKTSVYAQVVWAIGELGLMDYFVFHTSPLEIIYKPTRQKILFFGLDDAGKIKSVKLPFGYIGITWWEELDQYSGEAEIRKVMQSTMRGGDTYWNFMSFNPPISANNWANEYTAECEDKRKHDTLVVRSTYLDVPKHWLGQAFIDEAEYVKKTNERAYKNEYLGIPIGTGGNVFPNVCPLEMSDEMIGNFEYVYNGLDWGYANDPNAFVKLAFDTTRNDMYIFAEHMATHESNRQLFDRLYVDKKWNKKQIDENGNIVYVPSPLLELNEMVTADSAEPKSIADFRSWGCFMRPTIKYPESVRQGIKWLQSLNHIYIDRVRCPEAYHEFSTYEYERDKDGKVTSNYPDCDNHFLDGTRYATIMYWKRGGR